MKKNVIKLNETQLRNAISESIRLAIKEGFVKDMFFDKYYSKQNRKELLKGEKYYVFTGLTKNGYERHWEGTESENQTNIDWYGITKDSIGKIAGPFSYRNAARDWSDKNGINTPHPGDNVEAEWSPEKKAEQAQYRAEAAVRKELLHAAKKAVCDIFNSQTAGKIGLFKPGVTVRTNYTQIANGMKQYVNSPEAKKKLSSFFKTGGKEKDVRGAIYGGYKWAQQRLEVMKRTGF